MATALLNLYRTIRAAVRPPEIVMPADVVTRYKIVTVAGERRFMFIFESPVKLVRNGRGEYDDVAGTVQLRIEWSSDQQNWSFYNFRDAATPEAQKPDGTWVYRAISDMRVTRFNSQFARLCVHTVRSRPRCGLDRL